MRRWRLWPRIDCSYFATVRLPVFATGLLPPVPLVLKPPFVWARIAFAVCVLLTVVFVILRIILLPIAILFLFYHTPKTLMYNIICANGKLLRKTIDKMQNL